MLEDIRTMMWKEWKEVILQQAGPSRRGTQLRILIVFFLFGVVIPWRAGPGYVENPMSLVIPTFVPIFAILGTVTDSFAGERERHTLETLLASRLSDSAILIGKLAAAVLYAWSALIIMLVLGLVGVNLANVPNGLLMFPLDRLVTALIFNVLLSLVVASAGVLVSLRAATVRQAMQVLSLAFMAIVYGGGFGFAMLPLEWRQSIIQELTRNLLQTEILTGLALLILAALFSFAAYARFQRARLILD